MEAVVPYYTCRFRRNESIGCECYTPWRDVHGKVLRVNSETITMQVTRLGCSAEKHNTAKVGDIISIVRRDLYIHKKDKPNRTEQLKLF